MRRIIAALAVLLIAAFTAATLFASGPSDAATLRHRPHPVPSPTQTTPAPTPPPVVTTTAAPGPPTGYTLKYNHDFRTSSGFADWVVQPGAGAHVSSSTQFGMGIEMTALNQWAEIISSNAVITPDTYVSELIYAPAGSGSRPDGATFPAGSTANWPAWWTTGNPWPNNGEIDMLEAQTGKSCEQTHYGTSGEINSPSHCSQGNGTGTGWTTLTMLRTGEQVQVWYGGVFVGTVPLPTTANEKLIFQNQSYSTSVCGNCFGPTVLGVNSTAWLARVKIYSK